MEYIKKVFFFIFLFVFFIILGFNIYCKKKNNNNIKFEEQILKIDKNNKKRLNFAGVDEDTYNVMNSYILKGFETQRLKVNFTTDEDINKLGQYFEDIAMLKYTVNKDINDKKSGVKYLKECNKKLESYYFCIKIKETNEPIGQINIKFYEPGVMTMSYWIGKKFRRNGYMSEIGLNFTEDVFFKLKNVNKLSIYLASDNKGSKGYVEKLYNYLESKHKCYFNVFEKKDDNEEVSILYYILEKR